MATPEMEALSRDYVPEVSGPMVSEIKRTAELVPHYQDSDPLLRIKVQHLTELRPYMRTVRGDGNCGWRALLFLMFEAMIRSKDAAGILAERHRIEQLNAMLDRVSGTSSVYYEDWVEETRSLLDDLVALTKAGQIQRAYDAVLEAFNSEETSQAIIQHFRMLTSAWMNEHPDNYEPYLEDVSSVLEYTALHVNPHTAEMENMSLQGLYDCAIQGTGMAVEIMYLDRSPGEGCTVHRIEPHLAVSSSTGISDTLRLLYRIGHYDILYSAEEAQRMTFSFGTAGLQLRGQTHPSETMMTSPPAYSEPLTTEYIPIGPPKLPGGSTGLVDNYMPAFPTPYLVPSEATPWQEYVPNLPVRDIPPGYQYNPQPFLGVFDISGYRPNHETTTQPNQFHTGGTPPLYHPVDLNLRLEHHEETIHFQEHHFSAPLAEGTHPDQLHHLSDTINMGFSQYEATPEKSGSDYRRPEYHEFEQSTVVPVPPKLKSFAIYGHGPPIFPMPPPVISDPIASLLDLTTDSKDSFKQSMYMSSMDNYHEVPLHQKRMLSPAERAGSHAYFDDPYFQPIQEHIEL